jgi:hypothetical protein
MPEEIASSEATAPEGVDAGLGNEQLAANGSEDAGNGSNEQLVTVKVDGVETQVPLSEAVAGYQRQAHFTKGQQAIKAREQELAQADALYKAFEADPLGTLELLNEQFEELRQQGTDNEFGNEPDPIQQKLTEHEEFIQQQRETAAVQAVNAEIYRLQKQYGDFDRESLLQHAIDLGGVPLQAALADLLLTSGVAAQQQQHQQLTEDKRNLPPIAGGSQAAGSTGRPRSDGPPKSMKAALQETLDELGLTALPPIDPF